MGSLVPMLGLALTTHAAAAVRVINAAVTGPITVNAGDEVDIAPGGSVTVADDLGEAVTVNTGGVVKVSGGSVTAGFGGTALHVSGGSVAIEDGSVSAGNFGIGVRIDAGSVSVRGGSVSARAGGQGVYAAGGTVDQSGGSISVATGSGGPSGVLVSGATFSISGGSVVGAGAGVQVNAGSVAVSGGSLSAAFVSGFGPVGLALKGGSAAVSGGSVGVASVDSGRLTITGGMIGGLYVSSPGFVSISGCGFSQTLSESGGEFSPLTATLLDGTAMSISVAYGPDSLALDDHCASQGGAPLTITCPPDQTVTAPAGQGSAIVPVAMATATPPGTTVTGARSDGKALTVPYPLGVTTITWTATSGSDQAVCTQTITVQPGPPTITCGLNQVFYVPPGVPSVVAFVLYPTVSPADAAVVGARSDGKGLTDQYPLGVTTITWTATSGGLQASCTQTVTVLARTPTLSVSCPPDQTVTLSADQTGAVVAAGVATASVPGATVVGIRGDGKALADPYPVGKTTITWTATDGSGAVASCVQTITVTSVPPAVTCPPDQTLTAAAGQTSATVVTGAATGTGAGITVVGVRSDGKLLTDPYPVGTTTVTWTVVDGSGQQASCTQRVMVRPAITFPFVVIPPSQANPHLDSILVNQGPSGQRAIIHGSGFADQQGRSFVTLGGHQIPVLFWSAQAIGVLIDPSAYRQGDLPTDSSYPVQVVTPDSGRMSNTVDFRLTSQ